MTSKVLETVTSRKGIFNILFPKKSTVISQTIIGSTGAIIDIAVFSALIQYFSFAIAFLIGFSLAVMFNYYLTIKYSFKSLTKRKTRKEELFYFWITYLITGTTQYISIYILQIMNIDFIISKGIGILVAYALSFFLKWLLVFGKNSEY